MKQENEIVELMRQLDIDIDPGVDQSILDHATRRLRTTTQNASVVSQPGLWRILMRHKITKYALVALSVVTIVLAMTLLSETAAPAYAVEQSLEVYQTVRTVHVRAYEGKGDIDENRFADVWIQYDEAGRPLKSRMEMPRAKDGPVIRIWNQGAVRLWVPAENLLVIAPGDRMARQLEEFAVLCDPKRTLEHLYDARAKGTLELTITEPQQPSDPILLEVTYADNKTRVEYFIDAQTKLMQQVKTYSREEGQYELAKRIEFVAHNLPITASRFELSDIPDDAMIVDKTVQDAGLAQGDLTDAETAVKVVRECLEATIARDYDKAKKLMAGMPGDALERFCGGRILRIVSVGQPKAHERFPQGLCVPCKIEVAGEEGNRIVDFTPPVQRVRNQPDRWIIDDGSSDSVEPGS